MIEVTKYQCEYCGANYDTSEQCHECEIFHKDVDKVVKYKYYSKNMGPEAEYPHAVIVKMIDGKELIFKR